VLILPTIGCMTHDTVQAPRYVITATAREGIVQQTRVMAASAVILARSWQDRGYADVRVIDPQGDPLGPEAFRIKFMEGGRRFR